MHKNFGILNHVSLLASYNFDGFSAEIFVNSFHHFPHTFSTRFSPLVNRVFGVFNRCYKCYKNYKCYIFSYNTYSTYNSYYPHQ